MKEKTGAFFGKLLMEAIINVALCAAALVGIHFLGWRADGPAFVAGFAVGGVVNWVSKLYWRQRALRAAARASADAARDKVSV